MTKTKTLDALDTMPETYFQSSPRHLVPIEIDYSPEEADAIRECAEAEGMTVDEFHRQATQRYLEENGTPLPARRIALIGPRVIDGFPFFNTGGTEPKI